MGLFGSRRRPGAFWAAVGLAVVAVLGAVGTANAGHPLRALAVAALAPVLVAIGTFVANR